MERIPDERISRIKRQADLLNEVQKRGIALSKSGPEFKGLCPFHEEKTASFYVNEQKGEWHCFGCGEGGDVIAFIMKHDKKDFRQVLEELDGSPLKTPVAQPETAPKHSRALPDASSEKEALDVLLYYHHTLKNTPTALAYLQKRGLHHPEVIDHFKLGFANRTLFKHLPGDQSEASQNSVSP